MPQPKQYTSTLIVTGTITQFSKLVQLSTGKKIPRQRLKKVLESQEVAEITAPILIEKMQQSLRPQFLDIPEPQTK